MLTFTRYQVEARKTAIYPEKENITYPILGLVGEAGEIANKWKKVIRDEDGLLSLESRKALGDELSDVLWYCAALAYDLGIDLGDVAQKNLDKLKSRQERGTLAGSGDLR